MAQPKRRVPPQWLAFPLVQPAEEHQLLSLLGTSAHYAYIALLRRTCASYDGTIPFPPGEQVRAYARDARMTTASWMRAVTAMIDVGLVIRTAGGRLTTPIALERNAKKPSPEDSAVENKELTPQLEE